MGLLQSLLGETKMWACAHWCVSPNARTTQQLQLQIYAGGGEKTNGRTAAPSLSTTRSGSNWRFRLQLFRDTTLIWKRSSSSQRRRRRTQRRDRSGTPQSCCLLADESPTIPPEVR